MDITTKEWLCRHQVNNYQRFALGRTAVSAGTQGRSGSPTEVRTTPGAATSLGRRVARAGSQEMTLTARDRRPDRNEDQSFVIEVSINVVQH